MRTTKSFIEEGRDADKVRPEILLTASNLITELGYDIVSLEMIAERAGISAEQMGDIYADMQQVLNDLVGHHLHVHEGIRAFTRTDPGLSPLQSFLREWELMLEYMSHHMGTLQAYLQHQPDIDPWIRGQINLHRNQDIELLEKACDLKEIPRVNTTSLEAVLHGTLWGLISEFIQKQKSTDFESIPGAVSSRVLKPLMALR